VVADLVADLTMTLSLPIYKRGNTFVLHIRIAGRQIKRSLATNDPALAKLRAMQLLGQITADRLGQATDKQQFLAPPVQLDSQNAIATDVPCEIPVSQESNPPLLTPIPAQAVARNAHVLPTFFAPKKALEDASVFKMARVFGEYIAVKKIKEVTKVDYASYAKDITPFFKNSDIRTLTERGVSDLILHLRQEQGNDPRTIDNKIGFLRAVINHLIKNGQFFGVNPAAAKNLVSKRERRQSGTKPIAYNDLKLVFGDSRFAKMRDEKPNIYLIVMTGLVTGMRVSSVGRLTAADLKISMKGTHYIDISGDKTIAGNRDIPIPQILFESLHEHLTAHGNFGLTERGGGKGYSDAVNKPIKAFLKEHRLEGVHKKLSFHAFRKSFNDHLLKCGVEQYICGAVLGHVDETMTTGVYAKTPSVDVLAERIDHHQIEILNYLTFTWE
jgi:integrase